MINAKGIIIFLFLISIRTFSQTYFTSIDSLLTQNFNSVNLKNSGLYTSILNQSFIFSEKKLHTKKDSLQLLKPYTDAFTHLISELADMAGTPDFTVNYESFELIGQKEINLQSNDRIRLNVKLLINTNFTIKMPFFVTIRQGKYAIESPMIVMFQIE